MKKVIIITRATEYEGYSDFQQAIDNMDECQYNNSRNGLKQWFSEALWTTIKMDYNDAPQKAAKLLGLDSFFNQYDELSLNDDQTKADAFMIGKLKEQLGHPYASFVPDNHEIEVILVFPENLKINTDQAIPELAVFLQQVGLDCNIEGEDNILYIHDRQINGNEIDDIVVYNKDKGINHLDETDFVNLKGIDSVYKYVASFKHLPDSTSYFHGHILSRKFGQTDLLDDLIEFEQGISEHDDICDMINQVNGIIHKTRDNG